MGWARASLSDCLLYDAAQRQVKPVRVVISLELKLLSAVVVPQLMAARVQTILGLPVVEMTSGITCR